MYTRMIPAILLLLAAAAASVSFYSTGNDNRTNAGITEDYYFTLTNDYGTNVTWFNITFPAGFVIDDAKSDLPDQKNGSTYSYNVSLQPGDGVTKKIRAQAPSPLNDTDYSLTASCDQETVTLGDSVLAPLLKVTGYSAPAKVLANQVFQVNFTLSNQHDSSHSGDLYSVGSITSPNTDYQIVSEADVPFLYTGDSQNASITLKAPAYPLSQNITHTVYSRIAPFTYRDDFSTVVKTVYPVLNISIYNDSSYSVPAQEFMPNQTVYLLVKVLDPDDNSTIPGNLSITISDNDSSLVFFLQNFTGEQRIEYELNSTAVSGKWTVNATELTSGATAAAWFKVKAIISGLEIMTCRNSPCNQDTSEFAPADTMHALITPLDQAGRPVADDYNTSVTVTVDWNSSIAGQDSGKGELSVQLPNDYCTLTVNATAWNNQSTVSGNKKISIPLLYSLSLSPTGPYNYGQQLNVSLTFADVDGNQNDPDSLVARVSDDSGEYYNSSAPVFTFAVGGTVNQSEVQPLTVNYTKSHYNNSFTTSLNVTNQLLVQENVLSEYHTGETANLSFQVFHANGQPATANVTVTLVKPNTSSQSLWQGLAHEKELYQYFGQGTQTGAWETIYSAVDGYGNNASVQEDFNFSEGVTGSMSAPGSVTAGDSFTVTLHVANSLDHSVSVSAFLNNGNKQTALIPANGSHDFSWETSLYSTSTLTAKLEWDDGYLVFSQPVNVHSSGGSSSGYSWLWPPKTSKKEEKGQEEQEEGKPEKEKKPFPEITIRIYTPEEGASYHNPVTVGVVSNADYCVLPDLNKTLPGAFGNYHARLNFTLGVNKVRVSCVKGNQSISAERTFVVLAEEKRPGSENVLPAEQNNPEKGTRITGHAILGRNAVLGAAVAAGFFAFAVALRVIGPKVRKRYPIEGKQGLKRFF